MTGRNANMRSKLYLVYPGT